MSLLAGRGTATGVAVRAPTFTHDRDEGTPASRYQPTQPCHAHRDAGCAVWWKINADGTVRLFWESMGANGVWRAAFDGLYSRSRQR